MESECKEEEMGEEVEGEIYPPKNLAWRPLWFVQTNTEAVKLKSDQIAAENNRLQSMQSVESQFDCSTEHKMDINDAFTPCNQRASTRLYVSTEGPGRHAPTPRIKSP